MFVKLLLLFTLGPLVELYLLLTLGRRLGVLPTVFLVVATGFFGVLLAKAQGLYILHQTADRLQRGELPGDALINGLLILIGAAFLLTPGFISDTVGFLLLFPTSRTVAKGFVLRWLSKALNDGTLRIFWR